MSEPWYPGRPAQPLTPKPPRRGRGMAVKVVLVGAGVAAGAITATAIGAAATTTSGTGSGGTPSAGMGVRPGAGSTQAPPAGHDGHGGGHADENALGAALTAKLKAAALKAVPGGAIDRIETDSGDATYEAHMTKANGTKVTVKFDKNGNVTGVESGMGR